jgi:glycerol-3-phosphate acyltransferase PlsY
MMHALYLLACYLLGSIPTGYLAGRALRGIDIRSVGSGNMGATNVLRVLGKGPGAFVLAVDIAKGAAAVALLPGPFASAGFWPLAGAVAVVLGHNYTCFLKFKGGKGVATSAGACLGLAPWATLGIVLIFVLLVALTRMVSVGSLVAATALPVLVWYDHSSGPGVIWLALVLALFVWVRHIPNIKRILAGTENKLGKTT